MENRLTSPSRYYIAELPTNTLSDFETALESLRGELKLNDNVFCGVDGFLAKYFDNQRWSTAVKNTIRDAKSADTVNKLSTNISNIVHLDTLMDWLINLRSLFFTDNGNIRFRCEPIATPESGFSASIYLETGAVSTAPGSTRVYGEYHHGNGPVKGDDDDFLSFAARAVQVFNDQPTRHFLHAFLLHGTTLELWVFDRAGAYSSELVDLVQNPQELLHTLAGYCMMNDKESGVNTFVKCLGPGSDKYVSFDDDPPYDIPGSCDGDFFGVCGRIVKLYLRPEMLAAPGYLVGLGTTCFAASKSTTDKPNVIVKFSWRDDNATDESPMLEDLRMCELWHVIKFLGHQDLVSIADLRQGLQFPTPFVNRTLSCVITSPLGRPIRKFSSIIELLWVLSNITKAIGSLYLNRNMLHRDIAIKNLVIDELAEGGHPEGTLINFNAALDLDEGHPGGQPVGSDGFMAIGVLSKEKHTYRHDLESLFYVFLWLAIANDKEHDHVPEILERLPKTSRLQKWYSKNQDFDAIKEAVAADMSPEGFEGILEEFSAEFVPLRDLATELHELIFPVRDGVIFTGTDTDMEAAARLCDEIKSAIQRRADLEKEKEKEKEKVNPSAYIFHD
ncbi:hypothetical protein THARTR1_11136 [Trichoderma harzianum]|uniref:EKC/KEOPS complex subunit BUD32 n=1 Tax=Trichoderma harzianum TaxID=5544 RepID=A0A2K0TCI8_TRIHA|nr:hypothetical protein THARTR1_11136 [Trichoderma harzianum]